MDRFSGYHCSICGKTYAPDECTYTCPEDGGNLDVILDIKAIRSNHSPDDFLLETKPSLWRYLPLLPVGEPAAFDTPLHAAGGTPLYSLPGLNQGLGLNHLWIKDESRNPTGSFKDRASAVVVQRAAEIGAEIIVTASTGNAGAALAGMAAAAGQKAVIFAPRTAPPAKIAQLLVYGAQVFLVDGSYDDAVALAVRASDELGWYCRSTGYNPFTAEGKKTAALEIWQAQLRGVIRIPPGKRLSVFVSVGDGNIISGIHKGFKDLVELGWMEEAPAIYGVQAQGSAAIANAFGAGMEKIEPVEAKTIADSISVNLPSDGVRAVRAARETGGRYFVVSDTEILQAIASLGKVGIFTEPAGAAGYAGLVQAAEQGIIAPNDPVIVINTGSGLKDIKAAMQAVQEATVIEPSLDALKRVLQSKRHM